MAVVTVTKTKEVTTKMSATIGSRKYKRKKVTITTTTVPDVSAWEAFKEALSTWRHGKPSPKMLEWMKSPKE